MSLLIMMLSLATQVASERCEGFSADHCSDPAPVCRRTSYIEACSCSEGYEAQVVRRLNYSSGALTPWVEFGCCPSESGWVSDCGQEQEAVLTAVGVLLAASLVGILWATIIINCSVPLLPNKTANDASVETLPVTLDGPRLHESVAMSDWCVSLEDLKQFRRLVMHAVKDGRITPTERDKFDPSDLRHGPSMYTVNEQYIKPITAAAGRVSWALMKHPDGLRCDLFITHAWAEGIFEFVDKVVSCWPRHAAGAYVCFLSNPQNLDIGHLIASPESSPFAQAMQSATQVLVVSNKTCSIYSRLWCVYEAFLAYSWEKPINTARTLAPGALARRIRIACVCVASMSAFLLLPAEVLDDVHLGIFRLVFRMAAMTFSLLSLALLGSRGLRISAIHEAAVLGAAVSLGLSFASAIAHETFGMFALRDFLFCVGVATALEIDRQNSLQASKQVEELQRGFTACYSASCSSSSDAEAIWGQIRESNREAEVEDAVSVLRSMNIFSRELHATVERTGPLGDASMWNRTVVVASIIFFWGSAPIILLGHQEEFSISNYWLVLLTVLSALEAPTGLGLFAVLPLDRRAFAARAQIIWVLFLPTIFIPNSAYTFTRWFLQIFVLTPLTLAISALGPRRTARIPVLGPCFVRLIFFASVTKCLQKIDKKRRPSSGPELPKPEPDSFSM
ncbi:mak16-a [Symbiodinium necroappetens]|uniref:Mak16-a protein n=1 Tax=Symbiodinium necroappetens TaxID=1628268 RepID=A0A812MN11_9DINO|nr:mak16-a [Symbiodinium necroappetens]